jgi:hypothetical protein
MSILDDPGLFGRQWAATYDSPGNPDPAPAVEFLAGLAGGGPVLELAIGSGRVALPLTERGIAVEGIEASPEMVALLRAKPGGGSIPVVVGVRLKPFGMHDRWPEQIDELATAVGLHLEARYATWQREPFGPDSRDHISVYRKRS